jgi:hypothetical protein
VSSSSNLILLELNGELDAFMDVVSVFWSVKSFDKKYITDFKF